MNPVLQNTPFDSSGSSIASEVSIKKLSEIERKTAVQAIQQINQSVEWLNYNRPILSKYFNEESIRFAVKDGEIIGYVTMSPYTKGRVHVHPHYYIPYIAVLPNKRGGEGGFAAVKMMKEVIQTARDASASKIVLEYRGNNKKIQAFYKRVGDLEALATKDKVKGVYLNNDPKNKFTYYLA